MALITDNPASGAEAERSDGRPDPPGASSIRREPRSQYLPPQSRRNSIQPPETTCPGGSIDPPLKPSTCKHQHPIVSRVDVTLRGQMVVSMLGREGLSVDGGRPYRQQLRRRRPRADFRSGPPWNGHSKSNLERGCSSGRFHRLCPSYLAERHTRGSRLILLAQ